MAISITSYVTLVSKILEFFIQYFNFVTFIWDFPLNWEKLYSFGKKMILFSIGVYDPVSAIIYKNKPKIKSPEFCLQFITGMSKHYVSPVNIYCGRPIFGLLFKLFFANNSVCLSTYLPTVH